MMPKAQATQTKINKSNNIKLKLFCIAKEIIDKIKRRPTKWKKKFANHVFDKEVIPKIHQALKSTAKKQVIQLKSEQKTLHFFPKHI